MKVSDVATIVELLIKLRALMVAPPNTSVKKVDAYIVPSADAHHSEYVSQCESRREYITGFDGSAGTAVVTADYALLWTDSRYFIQAEEQLDGTEWILMRSGMAGVPSISEWLTKNLTTYTDPVVAVDPALYSKTEWDALAKELTPNDIKLEPLETNLVDEVWKDQPNNCSQSAIFELGIEFAGKNASTKLDEVRKDMSSNMADILVVSELEEVAWLLNLRGRDFENTPIFYSYVIVTMDNFTLFTNQERVNDTIRENLVDIGGEVKDYNEIADTLENLVGEKTGKIWVSKNCNYKLVNRVLGKTGETRLVIKLTPISLMKAVKNAVEAEGLMQAHIRDGAAVVEYFAWLEDQMTRENELTELSAAAKLEEFRRKKEHFFSLSFTTISASGPNAALPHYSPTPESDRNLSRSEIYLVDSGGQYFDGTTDITRTIYFGTPPQEFKEDFTRVLKGAIGLRQAVFPRKSVGSVVDTLARKPLWEVFKDFGHGTGHGIGHFLGVHEGPFSIGSRTGADDPGLEENMFTSDEPGFYKEGSHGIRTENMLRVVKANADGTFLKFEDVTLVPIQRTLIDSSLLTKEEITFLDGYHDKVRDTVGEYLQKNEGSQQALDYLTRETRQLMNGAAPLASHLGVCITTVALMMKHFMLF